MNKEIIKILLYATAITTSLALASCKEATSIGVIGGADGPTQIIVAKEADEIMYEQITQEEAKLIMDSGEEHIILDVREQEEYDEGHIPGAILIPYNQIDYWAEEKLSDKDAQILVYCRSGRRSKIAAETLSWLGYTNVKEFGGIIDWQYDIEK